MATVRVVILQLRCLSAVRGARRGPQKPRARPAGSWFMGTLHLITAVIGAGVLSLPQALAWLGWVVGIPLFVLFFCITM